MTWESLQRKESKWHSVISIHRGVKGKISMNKCVNCKLLIIHFVQDLI